MISGKDISKCGNSDNCPMKEQCVRYLATATKYQSYLLIPDEDITDKGCKAFWQKEEGD